MKEFLKEEFIKLDMEVSTKEEAINGLVELLNGGDILDNSDHFLKDVFLRENEGDTNIGQGIAIPHGKSEAVKQTSLAIGRTTKPIKWGEDGNEKVSIIILFAVRMVDNTSVHLKLLAEIAGKLGHDEVLEQLHNARSEKEILDVFI